MAAQSSRAFSLGTITPRRKSWINAKQPSSTKAKRKAMAKQLNKRSSIKVELIFPPQSKKMNKKKSLVLSRG